MTARPVPARAWRAAGVACAVALLLPGGRAAEAAVLRVTNGRDDGPGSLRNAIEAANAEAGSTIVVALAPGVEIVAKRQLPPLRASGTTFDGGSATLRQGEGCARPGGKAGCDGLVVGGPGISVRRLRVAGFLFDGVAVRGRETGDVRLEEIEAVDNDDDGIGVSDGAGPVFVDRCLLMGNGFRTKGKGLLAFGAGDVTLSRSVVVGNRDGITATRGSRVHLDDVVVVGNFDKGVGVSDASVDGRRVRIYASGRAPGVAGAAPNGDGLRVGLVGRAEFGDSRVVGNDDAGVVVLDTSTVILRGCSVAGNGGNDLVVEPEALLQRDAASAPTADPQEPAASRMRRKVSGSGRTR